MLTEPIKLCEDVFVLAAHQGSCMQMRFFAIFAVSPKNQNAVGHSVPGFSTFNFPDAVTYSVRPPCLEIGGATPSNHPSFSVSGAKPARIVAKPCGFVQNLAGLQALLRPAQPPAIALAGQPAGIAARP